MTTNLYPLNQDIFKGFHFGGAEEETAAEEYNLNRGVSNLKLKAMAHTSSNSTCSSELLLILPTNQSKILSIHFMIDRSILFHD
jgi:hypothetical protein